MEKKYIYLVAIAVIICIAYYLYAIYKPNTGVNQLNLTLRERAMVNAPLIPLGSVSNQGNKLIRMGLIQ